MEIDYTILAAVIGLGLIVRVIRSKGISFKLPVKAKKKQAQEDGNKLYGCTICTRWFASMEDLQDHSLKEHRAVVSVQDANYRVKQVNDEDYQEHLLQAAEYSQMEYELEQAQQERIEAKLLQEKVIDQAIMIQEGSTPASVCEQIIAKLQESDIEEGFNGAIQTTVRGTQIFFKAELILPHSEENLKAITQFAGAVKR